MRWTMTNKNRNIRTLIEQINKLAAKADALELTLGNGGQVGSMLGSIADDLLAQLEQKVRP